MGIVFHFNTYFKRVSFSSSLPYDLSQISDKSMINSLHYSMVVCIHPIVIYCLHPRGKTVVRKDVRHAQFAHSFENRRIKCS